MREPQQGDVLVFRLTERVAAFTFVLKRTPKTVILANVLEKRIGCADGFDYFVPSVMGTWGGFRKPVKTDGEGEFVEWSGAKGEVWDGSPFAVACSCKKKP